MLDLWETMRGDWSARLEAKKRQERNLLIALSLIAFIGGALVTIPSVPEPVRDIAIGMVSGIVSGLIVTKVIYVLEGSAALAMEGQAMAAEIERLGKELRKLSEDEPEL